MPLAELAVELLEGASSPRVHVIKTALYRSKSVFSLFIGRVLILPKAK
jgi:hypothetical protein